MNKGSKYYNYNTKKPLKIGHAQNTSKSYYLKIRLSEKYYELKNNTKKYYELKNGHSKIQRFKIYVLKSALKMHT